MPVIMGPDPITGRHCMRSLKAMGIDLISTGGTIKCSDCEKKFSRLRLIKPTKEQLCDSCLETKGNIEYIKIVESLDKEFPGS